MTFPQILIAAAAALAALIGAGWLGFRIPARRPRPLPAAPADFPAETVPIPDDLPAPVARYARAVFGDSIPVIRSAVISGRARLRIKGLTLPARFRFYHDAGQAYYHQIQLTWFGRPVLSVHERYLDGEAILALPGERIEENPQTNAAANQALWAESVWLPAVFFTDPRVRWEAVDAHTARLVLPDADPEEALIAVFDAQTGLLTDMHTCRYQQPDATGRTRWINRVLAWGTFHGLRAPRLADLRWGQEAPWATWTVDDIQYNVDEHVAQRLAHFGSLR